jgi:DNA-binding MarR family transcriptional regulator
MRAKERSPAVRRELHDVADRLHSIAIHLLRRLRRVDTQHGLSGPRLSALSVVVFGGPVTISELAAAEQVKVPTITRLVQALEEDGFLERSRDPIDGRVTRLIATAKGQKIMREGRERRVKMLSGLLLELPPEDVKAVRQAVAALEDIIAGRRTASA